MLIDAVAGYRDALGRSREFAAQAELVRTRLQAAVSNMPVGLCMFDNLQRLIISNDAYRQLYGIPPELPAPGTTLSEIFKRRADSGLLPAATLDEHKKSVEAQIATKERSLRVVELQDGRTVSILVQPLGDGGWVSVHEDITERRRAEERIAHMARHDALTGLPNRTSFADDLADACRRTARSGSAAVLCLDLDRFKSVNDTLGHPAGDALLRQVAARLKSCVRETDTVARFGGDEFAIIQTEADQPEAVTALAHRLIEALSAPYDLHGHQVVIGASIGIALAPADGNDPEVLLKNGDMALYRAKAEGRGDIPLLRARDGCAHAGAAAAGARPAPGGRAQRVRGVLPADHQCRPADDIELRGADPLASSGSAAWCRRPSSFRWPRRSA